MDLHKKEDKNPNFNFGLVPWKDVKKRKREGHKFFPHPLRKIKWAGTKMSFTFSAPHKKDTDKQIGELSLNRREEKKNKERKNGKKEKGGGRKKSFLQRKDKKSAKS